jgi:multiple sugar transport system substrate-binding protein
MKAYPCNNRDHWRSDFRAGSALSFCQRDQKLFKNQTRFRNILRNVTFCAVTSLIAIAPVPVMTATTLSMWVRSDGEELTRKIADAWNAGHDNKIELTVIPSPQMVTKFATAAAAGDVPDILSIDLIFMPDFMKAGFMTDITDQMKDDPNIKRVSPSHIKLATYKGRLYGVPGTPDVSVLLWNKDLFKRAGLDPEKGPTTMQEVYEDAKKIRALGPDIYGYYIAGNCGGCNIFTVAPMMWATGAHVVPTSPDDEALKDGDIKGVLEILHKMWVEGLMPEAVRGAGPSEFHSAFYPGKLGMFAHGNFQIGLIKNKAPDLDFGITFIPGLKEGQVSSFAGGDVISIPKASKHAADAIGFLKWVMTDEPQIEVYAKGNFLPSRTDLVNNKYFKDNPKLIKAAGAVAIAETPWTFHFNDMVNDASSPWLKLIQRSVFDGQTDDAIAEAKKRMHEIISEE